MICLEDAFARLNIVLSSTCCAGTGWRCVIGGGRVVGYRHSLDFDDMLLYGGPTVRAGEIVRAVERLGPNNNFLKIESSVFGTKYLPIISPQGETFFELNVVRYSLLQGFDLSLLKEGVSSLNILLDPQMSSQIKDESHFPDDLLSKCDPRLIEFFVRDRVGGISSDPSGPPQLSAVITQEWQHKSLPIFESHCMQQHLSKCQEEVDSILQKLQEHELGASMAHASDLNTEMVNEKEVELEVQVIKEVVRMLPTPVEAFIPWRLKSLSSHTRDATHELPFFSASQLSFQDTRLPFPECVTVSKNFCHSKPEGRISAVHFALNWNDGCCTRTTILSLAEAVAVRRAAQRQLYQTSESGVVYEIAKITGDCESKLVIASSASVMNWHGRLSCCRFIQGDIWMGPPDDVVFLQALESSGRPLRDIAPPADREKWFVQCLLSQVYRC